MDPKTIVFKQIERVARKQDAPALRAWVTVLSRLDTYKQKRTVRTYVRRATAKVADTPAVAESSFTQQRRKQLRTQIRETLATRPDSEWTMAEIQEATKSSASRVWRALQGMHGLKRRVAAHGKFFYQLKVE
jgi:hypothetical protein